MARELTSEELRGRWWDGTYFRIVVGNRVRAYDADGRHISSLDYNITHSSPWYMDGPNGIIYIYDRTGCKWELDRGEGGANHDGTRKENH